ncbi:MT-A70 family methyltransferase [Sphingobium sp. DEHP117]|uniref:MT-A70 family methyltransferase n=1 Tax=Sphingobium sp. DEHP117 TaxID=2993436 RepID=UPI0027D54123|nr:MT-A70 family methyltransferase [Sphingobium sp. DEHP117]MDQ4421445.1 MT-A70 family methyltransferase [Sphingobium sp. DEHP117]
MGGGWPFGDLRMFGYGVLHIDPAWSYQMYSEKGHAKSPHAHYDCMSIDELKSYPVGDLAAPDAVMVMWGVFPMMPEALELMAHYGFQYKTGGAWAKQSPTGKAWSFGTGYIFRGAAEFYIVGTIGQPRQKSKSVRNLIVEPRREHSRKPDQIYRDIEALWDGPYIDVFGRQQRTGWDVFGNEIDKFGEAA